MPSSSKSSSESSSELAWRALRTQDPQLTVDGFWKKFVTRFPGRVNRVLPGDLYAKRAFNKTPNGAVTSQNAAASFDEAAASCKAKVSKIVKECRRLNQKYTDSHFDIETDLKWGICNCLNGLVDGDYIQHGPMSVKRVPVRPGEHVDRNWYDITDNIMQEIFESQFFVDGASAGASTTSPPSRFAITNFGCRRCSTRPSMSADGIYQRRFMD